MHVLEAWAVSVRLCVSVWECEIPSLRVPASFCNCAIIICISAAHLLFTKTYSRRFHSRDLSHYEGEKKAAANWLREKEEFISLTVQLFCCFFCLWTHPSLERPAPLGWGRWASCSGPESERTAPADRLVRPDRRLGCGSDSEPEPAKGESCWVPIEHCCPVECSESSWKNEKTRHGRH